MKNKLLVIIIFFIVLKPVLSQEERKADSFLITDEININDTPIFYSNYFSEFKINENLFFRLGREERSTNDLVNSYTVTEFPLLTKYFISNKFSVLFGPKVGLLRKNGSIETNATSLFSTFGFQYDITDDFSIYGGVNLRLTKKDPSVNYSVGNNMIYKFGTRLKF
ncbi:hypothetical protein Q4Q35_16250 [Flavivirga aquimarina]|uniref:Outer membrane protein beta-barrel domain-containing protein n=1 Tax=Flavivirga aquimarina TaxID=2027862 RepID=A0ABT8WDW7_9FLAO|nr:hypothetical protein [Flavivirga aquimarina]MDO5971359.1 hypothetical protein [Flavivirga aquimarina]